MSVYIDTTKPTPIRRFRLDVGEQSISVSFGRNMPPMAVRARILHALDVMLPDNGAELEQPPAI